MERSGSKKTRIGQCSDENLDEEIDSIMSNDIDEEKTIDMNDKDMQIKGLKINTNRMVIKNATHHENVNMRHFTQY